MQNLNLTLPGNPRYQPKELMPYFGYDKLYYWYIRVELATLDVLADIGIIPKEEEKLLTAKVRTACLNITTTQVDAEERQNTKHDIGALRNEMKKVLPEPLHKWIHIPLTSYDVIDSGRPLMYKKAHMDVISPAVKKLLAQFCEKIKDFKDVPQIGRTHGQHGVPITAGFWLAQCAHRVFSCIKDADDAGKKLHGKISGPVGSYNAQYASGILAACGEKSFEIRVLKKLGLSPARISTQIAPPEALAHYLNCMVLLSGALAQFADDCRHLMRTEIGEVSESFEKGQVGSSTMGQKRNPINFENICGMFIKNQAEYFKVSATLTSEHQRDLRGSCVARDFPTIVINTWMQISTLLRKNETGASFFERITIDVKACARNLSGTGNLIMAEPFYIALQMAGYSGDAHELVNHTLVKMIKDTDHTLLDAACGIEDTDKNLKASLKRLPKETIELLRDPKKYTGLSSTKAMEIVEMIQKSVNKK